MYLISRLTQQFADTDRSAYVIEFMSKIRYIGNLEGSG